MPKTKKQKIIAAFFALSFAEILWGVNVPVVKLGLQNIPLPVFLSVTLLGAGLLTLPLALRHWKPISAKNYTLLIIGSLIGITLGNVVLLMGFERIPSVNAALIGLFGPLILFILSVEFLKERFNLKTFLGILVAFLGAVIIIGKPWGSGADQYMITGGLFILLAVLCSVVATLIYKPILKKVDPYQVTSLHLLFGITPIAIYSLPNLQALAPGQAGKEGYVAIFFNIVLITFANCLFMYGLKIKRAQQVGIFGYLHPIAAAAGGWLILSEVPDKKLIVGAFFVFAGLWLAEAKSTRNIRLHYHHSNRI